MSKYKPYPKYKDSGVEWLGQVPEEWPVIRIGYGYDVVLGKMLQPSAKDAADQLVPYLKAANVQWENIAGEPSQMWASNAEIQKFFIRKGDLLVCEGGEVGRCALVPYHPDSACIIQNSIHRVRGYKGYNVNYLLRVLETANAASWFDILCNKATIAHFTRDKFASLRIPAPGLDAQEKIVEYLNQECSHIETIISKQEHLINLLEEKRISIISHAVTKGLDPDAPIKHSGIDWIGTIPKNWVITRLKFVGTVQTGIAKGKNYTNQKTISVPYLRVANVQNGFLSLDNVANIEISQEEHQRYLLRVGDVLMNEGGDYDKLGRGTIWRGEIENCIHQNHVFAVRPHAVTSEWLNLFASSSSAQFYFMSLSKQSTNLASISSTNLMELPIVLPPADEQASILAYLDRETAKIDAIINRTHQAITLAKEHRSAIISAAVTGKICVSRQQSSEKPLSKSREYFQKVVLAAEITNQLHQEKTFGRVKLQKILFLSEYHAQLPFQRSEYQRYAAGPHDPKAMYSIEGQMKKQKWFDSRLREGGYGKEYIPLERHEAYKQYYERYFADKHDVIQRIIDLLRPKDTQFCEVVATLYGIWNDFLLEGQQPDDAAMFREAVTNWAPEKKKVPTGLWPKALLWMRENGLVPPGWGEPTIHRQEA